MNRIHMNYIARTLAEVYSLGLEERADKFMETLEQIDAANGNPPHCFATVKSEYYAYREVLISAGSDVRENVRTEDECLSGLYDFSNHAQNMPLQQEALNLYQFLVDYWMTIREDGSWPGNESLNEGQQGNADSPNMNEQRKPPSKCCGNCKWCTESGDRCGNLKSGYFPDRMYVSEHCCEWQAKTQHD